MSELTVEPVESVESVDDAAVPRGVDAPEYVLYGGKGAVAAAQVVFPTPPFPP